jgi:diguanylate cyclase (GGDEF)-like protein
VTTSVGSGEGANRQLFALAAGTVIVLGAIGLWVIDYVSGVVEERAARANAQSYVDMLVDIQSFYSREVVAPTRGNGIRTERDFRSVSHAIPYPATLMLELVRDLNRRHPELRFRFFSDAPFYPRPDSGPADAFERDALAALRASHEQHFTRVESGRDGSTLRLALAQRMESACVSCHNAHPDSPRHDWRLGELRGIYAVSVPLAIAANAPADPLVYIAAAGYLFVSLLLVGLVYALAKYHDERQRRRLIDRQNSALSEANHEIERVAFHDAVTGLPNRPRFNAELAQRIAREGPQHGFALAIVDLDHFKNVNDWHGHLIGDRYLAAIAARLAASIGPGGFAARLSGDEFALIIEECEPHRLAAQLQHVIDAAVAPLSLDGLVVTPGVSLGVARFPEDGRDADELLADAGYALRLVKDHGRGGFHVFDDALRREAEAAREIEGHLRTALGRNALAVHHQPKVCLQSGRILGFEALLRWHDDVLGLVRPDVFLPAAARAGLVPAICRFLFETVEADLARGHFGGPGGATIAINLHPIQLKMPADLIELLRGFERLPDGVSRLVREITENCVIGRGTENVPMLLTSLAERGIRLSLDDFGTGFASLTHLKELPVAEIKIDRSFIRDLDDGPEAVSIVRSMVSLARELGIDVVVEGLEKAQHVAVLREIGCRVAQGYLFAPAVTRDVVRALGHLPMPFAEHVSRQGPPASALELASAV